MTLAKEEEHQQQSRTIATMNSSAARKKGTAVARNNRSNSNNSNRTFTASSMTSFLVLVSFFVGAILVAVVVSSPRGNNGSTLRHRVESEAQQQQHNQQQQQQHRSLCACAFIDGEFLCDCRGRARFENRDDLREDQNSLGRNVDPPAPVAEEGKDELLVEIQHDVDKLQHDIEEELKQEEGQEPDDVDEVVVVVPFPTDEEPDEQLSDPQQAQYPHEERDYFKTSWPELVGMPGAKAREIILAENPALAEVWLVPMDVEGQMSWTADYRPDRVHITVDDSVDLVVLETPTVG